MEADNIYRTSHHLLWHADAHAKEHQRNKQSHVRFCSEGALLPSAEVDEDVDPDPPSRSFQSHSGYSQSSSATGSDWPLTKFSPLSWVPAKQADRAIEVCGGREDCEGVDEADGVDGDAAGGCGCDCDDNAGVDANVRACEGAAVARDETMRVESARNLIIVDTDRLCASV